METGREKTVKEGSRGRKAESRRRKAEGGRQKAEGGRQKGEGHESTRPELLGMSNHRAEHSSYLFIAGGQFVVPFADKIATI
jgi:hypothetical protein